MIGLSEQVPPMYTGLKYQFVARREYDLTDGQGFRDLIVRDGCRVCLTVDVYRYLVRTGHTANDQPVAPLGRDDRGIALCRRNAELEPSRKPGLFTSVETLFMFFGPSST